MIRTLLLTAAFGAASVGFAQEEPKSKPAPPDVQRPPAPAESHIATIAKIGTDDIPFHGNLLVRFPVENPGAPQDLVVHTGKKLNVCFFEPFRQASLADLKIGTRIYFEPGPIAKSRPAQTSVSVIFIMNPPGPAKN